MKAYRHDISIDDVVTMYNNGESSYQIAKKFGTGHATIIRRLHDGGVKLRSIKEASASQRGEKNARWNGGSHIHFGYRNILTPEDSTHTGKYILEHRYVWEKAHGKIPKGIVIHHKNGDKLDNRLENLEAMTQKEHGMRDDLYTKRIKELEQEVERLKKLVGE